MQHAIWKFRKLPPARDAHLTHHIGHAGESSSYSSRLRARLPEQLLERRQCEGEEGV
ncbi:MAG: hypothetical protein ABI821_06485 [Pseudomonadota bacterium]